MESSSSQLLAQEAVSEAAAAASLSQLHALEGCQLAALQSATSAYLSARPSCTQTLALLAVQFGGGDHAVHDALAIMDRSTASLPFSLVSLFCFCLEQVHAITCRARSSYECWSAHVD